MYTVTFYQGSYRSRQEQANNDKCDLYVEHHFNSVANESANYSVVILGTNCSAKSIALGNDYIKNVTSEFGTRMGGEKGLMIGGYNGRGNENLSLTNMPAMLLEPLFCSNPEQANLLRSDAGQERLAKVLMDTIKSQYPNGARIAFSVGHKYKGGNSKDLGAMVYGGGYEADFAELVLQKCQKMFTGTVETATVEKRVLKIVINDKVFEEIPVEGGSVVTFDEVNQVIRIKPKAS